MYWHIVLIIYTHFTHCKINSPPFPSQTVTGLNRQSSRQFPFTLTRHGNSRPPFFRYPQFIRQREGPGEQLSELPNYDDAALDYSYMTKNRNDNANQQANAEESNTEVTNENAPELAKNQVVSQGQAGTFGENSGNMSNNTNSNNTTTNHYHNGEPNKGAPATAQGETPTARLKDDVPLGAMQSPTTNLNNTTDASHHKGDTSTFVTNNFYNPPNPGDQNTLTVGGQLEYEYLWKRIYDIDNKLAQLTPIVKQASPERRKGLIITFDPEEKGKVDVESNPTTG
ncbi:hypothetical protein MACK_002564 [Theileria orientalis]|uniref:Uncharacterized protein n=1 Tax=Theileria orientalis TaxID=68886 RepID=A0A976MD57_THEOR|nr:hypothetical protein MACK_002564 [Theileria orientalis]